MSNIYDVNWSLGAHTCFAGRICDTLWTSINYGMYTTQFFMGNPRSFNRTCITSKDIDECKKILSKFDLNVFTHYPYIANLAGSKDSLAWSGDSKQDAKTRSAIKGLEYELQIIASLGVEKSGVVIHPGSYKDRTKGLEKISETINKINFPEHSKLLLENTAGEGDTLAIDFLEIKKILSGIHPDKLKHIGICIDTCHTFASGLYDLRKDEEVDKMFKDFENTFGLDKFNLLHLNDSMCVHKSRKDRHACIGQGNIWQTDKSSLVYLLDKCQENGIPMVLETHGLDMLTIANLK